MDFDEVEYVVAEFFEEFSREIRENVDSVDVNGVAYSRTSDIDNCSELKEKELTKKLLKTLKEL